MPLTPETQAMLLAMAQQGAPVYYEMPPDDARAAYKKLRTAGPPGDAVAQVEDRMIPGPGGEIPVRIYRPDGDGPFPGLLFFHGGGWVLGDVDTHDRVCRTLANGAASVVLSVDYRRAPEHKYPAAADDCYAATVWLAEHSSELNVDASRLAVCGDSAGGNLAAVVPLMARDRSGPALAAQILIYPVTDHSFDTRSYRDNAEGYGLGQSAMRWFWDHYLDSESDGAQPYASPLRAGDLSGLPPALVISAEFDPLRDEGEAYAERLREAGVDTRLTRCEGVVHGFVQTPDLIPEAGRALTQIAQQLRTVFTS